MYCELFVLTILAFHANGLHEPVVEAVLQKVTANMTNRYTELNKYSYSFQKRIGALQPITFTISLSSGRLVIQGTGLKGPVDYNLTAPEGPANFKYQAVLNSFLSYNYAAIGGGSTLSRGSLTGNWRALLNVDMDVEPSGCNVKVNSISKTTESLEMDVTPQDSFIFPVTIHFPPNDLLEKNVEGQLQQVLNSSFNGVKICDCISCNSQ